MLILISHWFGWQCAGGFNTLSMSLISTYNKVHYSHTYYSTYQEYIKYRVSLAVEGLNREEIGIEEIFVPNEAESNGQ